MPPTVSEINGRFQEIAATILNAPELPVDPWLYRYCGSAGTPAGAEKYVRYHTDLLALAGRADEFPVVVDAGSGFGFASILVALWGAERVFGVEINPEMVRTYEVYAPLLPDDLRSRLDMNAGDVISMPIPDASADLLLSIEAISHYLDVDAFLDDAYRVLRPGGTLLISDGNNGSNPRVRSQVYELWEAFERGTPGQTLHGHLVGTPYEQVRRQLLDEEFPALHEATRAELARRTAAYTAEQVRSAAREHETSGTLPDSVYEHGTLAIAPDGAAMERLFVPSELVRTLERRGFSARAYGYWGGAAGRPWVRTANQFLTAASRFTMPTAPSFRVVARKSSA